MEHYLENSIDISSTTSRENHPQFRINFQFSYRNVYKFWILDQLDSAPQEPERTVDLGVDQEDSFVILDLHEFLIYENARQFIIKKFQTRNPSWRPEWIDNAMERAKEVVTSMQYPSHNAVFINFGVTAKHEIVFDARRISSEEDKAAAVRGAKTRIESLDSETCSICLEDFSLYSSRGEDVLFMPCSHGFHGGCIGRWLRISSCCPNCRFQMPTRREQESVQL